MVLNSSKSSHIRFSLVLSLCLLVFVVVGRQHRAALTATNWIRLWIWKCARQGPTQTVNWTVTEPEMFKNQTLSTHRLTAAPELMALLTPRGVNKRPNQRKPTKLLLL